MKKCLIALITFFLASIAFALRDPTLPPGYSAPDKKVSTNFYTLNAIIISANSKLAAINGTYVKEGDIINDAKVISINTNSVQLDSPTGKITLILLVNPLKPSGTLRIDKR